MPLQSKGESRSAVTNSVTKWVFGMAGKDRYLQERNGRFYARLVVPEGLRPHLDNKTELRAPLGADRRAAVKALPGAVVEIQKKLDVAERARAGSSRHIPLKFPLATAFRRSKLLPRRDLSHLDPRQYADLIDRASRIEQRMQQVMRSEVAAAPGAWGRPLESSAGYDVAGTSLVGALTAADRDRVLVATR